MMVSTMRGRVFADFFAVRPALKIEVNPEILSARFRPGALRRISRWLSAIFGRQGADRCQARLRRVMMLFVHVFERVLVIADASRLIGLHCQNIHTEVITGASL